MKRHVLLLAAALGIFAAPAAAQGPPADRPNIILVMTDDQGYGDFGFAGNPIVRTPNLNRLAAESARMSQFYVSPVCAPTRASLMTGRYNYRTRVVDTYLGRAMMAPEEVTVAEVLREAGYATGIFGKWHLGDNYPMRPMDQGFEEALVHRGGGIGQPSDPPGGEGRYTDPILFHNGEARRMEGYCTDIYFESAIAWMDAAARDGRPFFTYIATNAPHGPFHDVPDDTYVSYRDVALDGGEAAPHHAGVVAEAGDHADRLARIFAMITNIDQNLGRLLTWLDRRGLSEETLLVFLVDNGPNTRRYVRGHRGMKGEVYEGGVRSPLLVRWPGRLAAGAAPDRIAAHIDVMPTLLEVAGAAPPAGVRLDGRSLLPLLEGGDAAWPDRTLFIQAHRGDAPVRYHHFMARSQRWKLVNNSGFGRQSLPGAPAFELFDLQHDPLETRDVADRHPEVVADLRARYDAWFDDVGSTRPGNFAPPRIHVGTVHEDPVVLTRQDWRYSGEGGGWRRDALGYWLLHVADEGPYDVLFRFDADDASGVATLRAAAMEHTARVDGGAERVMFEGVALPEGDLRLDAVLTHGAAERGVHQVELRRAAR